MSNSIPVISRFGEFELDRSVHELRCDGQPIPLEGRAMALLMLLVEQHGELVTREQIITRLWGSDAFVDADSGINTAVRKLRQALGDSVAQPRYVKTVHGKGYRLMAPLQDATQETVGWSWRSWPAWKRLSVIAIAVIGVGILAIASKPPSRPLVQVTALKPLSPGPAPRAFADLVRFEITAVMNESGVQTAPPPLWRLPTLRRSSPQFLFGGTVSSSPGKLSTRVYMIDAGTGLTLWTREFRGLAGDEQRLADAAAGAAAETLYLALEPQAQKDFKLPPNALAAHIRGGVAFRSPSAYGEGAIRQAYEQLTTLAPGFALGHGELALLLAMEAAALPPPEADALRARAERAARHAIQIDPRSAGYAYGALGVLASQRRPPDLAAIEKPYRDGARLQPEFGPFHMRLCDVLTDVGRNTEALLSCRRAVGLRPMATPTAWKYAAALNDAGAYDRAVAQIEKAARYDPEDAQVRLLRLQILALGPDPTAALALLDDPRAAPPISAPMMALMRDFLKARQTARPSDVDGVVRRIQTAVDAQRFDPGLAARMLTKLDRLSSAREVIDRRIVPARDLLSPALEPLRNEPPFWAAVERAGLLSYWRATGSRPDFCAKPRAPAPCDRLIDQSKAPTPSA